MKALRVAFVLLLIATGAVRAEAPSLTPLEHRRPADQTILTLPEWFLVFSPDEFARYVTANRPTSAFPFAGHISEFWQLYWAVYRETAQERPFNAGYHLMIVVIGLSTSVEYAIREGYESLFGRLAEAARSAAPTDEERYAAKVARDYVAFIRVYPWYQFDFAGALAGLWRDTSPWGADPVRKWERKYALTTEYLIKAGYGWVIGKATHGIYDVPSPVTAIVIDKLPAGLDLPDLKVIGRTPAGIVATVPRYDAFTTYTTGLAKAGVHFIEVAGNHSDIVISALAGPDPGPLPPEARILFTQPILTSDDQHRIVLAVPVSGLGEALIGLEAGRYNVEHVYDY